MLRTNSIIVITAIISALAILGCTPGFITTKTDTAYYTKLIERHPQWPKSTLRHFKSGRIMIGMTKEQIFYLLGSPHYWIRHNINGDIYETWLYAAPEYTSSGNIMSCDFKNGYLTGFSGGNSNSFSTKGCYHTKGKVLDVRDWQKLLSKNKKIPKK